jgi:hypothetical protein
VKSDVHSERRSGDVKVEVGGMPCGGVCGNADSLVYAGLAVVGFCGFDGGRVRRVRKVRKNRE